MQETPRANRLHIGLFGKRNSGKSSLINALTNQEVALVSDIAGTTTDPVYKAMEIHVRVFSLIPQDLMMKVNWEHFVSSRLCVLWIALTLHY